MELWRRAKILSRESRLEYDFVLWASLAKAPGEVWGEVHQSGPMRIQNAFCMHRVPGGGVPHPPLGICARLFFITSGSLAPRPSEPMHIPQKVFYFRGLRPFLFCFFGFAPCVLEMNLAHLSRASWRAARKCFWRHHVVRRATGKSHAATFIFRFTDAKPPFAFFCFLFLFTPRGVLGE